MKKVKSSPAAGMTPKAMALEPSMIRMVVETPLSTITSKPMSAGDADAIRTMLVERLATLNCLLVATEAGDVIIGGEALRQSLVRFQTVAGKEEAMATLLAQVNNILSNSTHADARDFDAKTWLEAWVLVPQLSLSGAAPIDLIGTDVGLRTVQRTLAAVETGAYL